jgi:hypothetical protein
MMEDETTLITISGRVQDRQTRRELAGLQVEAWDKDMAHNELLGRAVTDTAGRFAISFRQADSQDASQDQRLDVFFRVFHEDTMVQSIDDALLWHLEAGEHKVTILLDAQATPGLGRHMLPSLNITGQVINRENGYPLSQFRVLAYGVQVASSLPDNGSSELQRHLLGEGTSDGQGAFTISLDDSAETRQQICLLARYPGSRFILEVENTVGVLIHTSEPIGAQSGSVSVLLAVELPAEEVAAESWVTLGERLEQAQTAQFNHIVSELTSSDPDSLFNDWSVETRHAMLSRLEQAFLDPSGVLTRQAPVPGLYTLRSPGALEAYIAQFGPTFDGPTLPRALNELRTRVDRYHDLTHVDWFLEIGRFKKYKIEEGISDFWRDVFQRPEVIEDGTRASDLIRYRDYLRSIFARGADPVLITHLEKRFHQNFRTIDLAETPAHKILIDIATRFLTAPTGDGHGFGLAPPDIPAQDGLSDREYLGELIKLTGLPARELELRYRVELERPAGALTSPVQENITTLQAFYRDGYNSYPEPHPIITTRQQGTPPFFMHYEEWLRTESVFYPENVYDIADAFVIEATPDDVGRLDRELSHSPDSEYLLYVKDLLRAYNTFRQGLSAYQRGQFTKALEGYESASDQMPTMFQAYTSALTRTPRRDYQVWDARRLQNFAAAFAVDLKLQSFESDDMGFLQDMLFAVERFGGFVVRVCKADAYLALGDYPKAVGCYAELTAFAIGLGPLARDSKGWPQEGPRIFREGDAPYTYPAYTLRGKPVPRPDYFVSQPRDWIHGVTPFEERFFRLRHGNAMLEWADALYRTDDASNIARARELYKAVLWLHGEPPPVDPYAHMTLEQIVALRYGENPAIASQKARARLGFHKVEAGLNYHGYTDDLVPPMRYQALREAADRFAAMAKSAQQDYLAYVAELEAEEEKRMTLATALKKAQAQVEIADEQIEKAKYDVEQAQKQVEAVQAAIEAKWREIEEADSFLGQLTDYVTGMVDTFKKLPGDTQSAVKSGLASEALEQPLKGEGMLGLGAGASVVTGMGAFFVASYLTMSDMTEAANRRRDEWENLRQVSLPAAQAVVELKGRDVTIANLLKEIAQADAELAGDLLAFGRTRILNASFWRNVAAVMQRLMHRYLDLGARTAWMAERALAYELDQPIDVVRMNYYPERLHGVTGADLLQGDLAELEATRIAGLKQMLPIKHTISLARDFPLAFGQLKKTGQCSFHTDAGPFALAYPGTYGHRIRAVTVTTNSSAVTNPVRGLLVNQGISSVSRANSDRPHLSVRPVEALPISEFSLREDLEVYGLPNEMLYLFEGSGVDTHWELLLPAHANPYGLGRLADVLITVDAYARHSSYLQEIHLGLVPDELRRWIMVSGRQTQPEAVEALRGKAGIVEFAFDLHLIGLSNRETGRRVANLALIVPGAQGSFDAVLSTRAVTQNISIAEGVALSNNVQPAPQVPAALNSFVDQEVAQRFAVRIDAQQPGTELGQVNDLILAIEYTATLHA